MGWESDGVRWFGYRGEALKIFKETTFHLHSWLPLLLSRWDLQISMCFRTGPPGNALTPINYCLTRPGYNVGIRMP